MTESWRPRFAATQPPGLPRCVTKAEVLQKSTADVFRFIHSEKRLLKCLFNLFDLVWTYSEKQRGGVNKTVEGGIRESFKILVQWSR